MRDNNSEQEILTLTDREKCRLRTPVFMGSFDCRMINLNEILMNARDEVNTNFDKGEIHIHLHDDMKKITIKDTGRGIPIKGIDALSGIKRSELIFKTLFSGGNFENINKTDGDNFIENCGQNGSGLTTTQYISTYFQGTQIMNYKAYEITYRNGGLEEEEREYKSEYEHGTIITYSLDPEVVTGVIYTYEEVYATIKRIASTTKDKIKYAFTHKENEDIFEYNTFEDYFEENFESILPPIIHFNEKSTTFEGSRDGKKFKEGNRIEVLLSLSTSPIQETYLNGGYLPEQGTFYKGVIEGIKKSFQKEIKGKTRLSDNDIAMSFNIYGVMGSNNPVYSNQTKNSSSNDLYRKLASEYIVGNMEVFKAENPQEFDNILKHLEQINVLNTKNEKIIKNIKKKLNEKATSATSRPLKLIPCRSKNPEEVELILIEGDSAMTSVKASRNPNTMMILPLKGKPINALKQSLERLLGNQEILDIFKILECGVTYKGKNVKGFDKFDINKLAVNKVLIATDFDDDGFHIQSLLIGVFYILAPQLLSHGVIEFIQTPLYLIKTKNEIFKVYSENERRCIISNLNCKYSEVRFKGIGGLPVKVMKEALSMDTRISYKITMNDAKKCADKIELFLSDNVEARKKYIEENGDKFVNETLFI